MRGYIVAAMTLLLGAGPVAFGQNNAAEEKQKLIKEWEGEVGKVFDKFDRDDDGTWSARESRLGVNGMNNLMNRYLSVNQALERHLAEMPRTSNANGGLRMKNGVIRGDQPPFSKDFTPPANPYEPASKDGANRKPMTPPQSGSTKDSVVKYYVSIINHLYGYNQFLRQEIQSREASIRNPGGATTGRRR